MGTNIHPSAVIDKEVKLGEGVTIGPHSVIKGNVEIGDDCYIHNHVSIFGRTQIGRRCQFWPMATIGCDPNHLRYKGEDTELIIGDDNSFKESCNIHRGTSFGGGRTVIGNNCFIMTLSHIAHDCIIGDNLIMTTLSAMAGHAEVGNHVTLSAFSGLNQRIRVGDYSMVAGYTNVRLDVAPFSIVSGTDEPRVVKVNKIRLEKCGISEENKTIIEKIFKMFFRSKLGQSECLKILQEKFGANEHARNFIDFVSNSKNGILR